MAEREKGSAWRIPAKHLPVLLPTLVRTQRRARTGPSTQEHGTGSSSCFCSSQWLTERLGCFSPSAQQPGGLGTVGSGTGGNTATAASCLGTLQVCCRIWMGFPSSPLPAQLPLATGHCLLHVEKGGRRTAGFWSRGWVFCVMMRSCTGICRGYKLWWGSGGRTQPSPADETHFHCRRLEKRSPGPARLFLFDRSPHSSLTRFCVDSFENSSATPGLEAEELLKGLWCCECPTGGWVLRAAHGVLLTCGLQPPGDAWLSPCSSHGWKEMKPQGKIARAGAGTIPSLGQVCMTTPRKQRSVCALIYLRIRCV